MCKHKVKKLPFVTKFVLDQYKTWQMCHKAVLENDGMLESVSDCYKNQQMWDKAVDNYPHTLKNVPDSDKTQKCVIKPSILFLLQQHLFLNAIRLKKCLIKLLIDIFP